MSDHEQDERERLAKMYAAMADGELLKLAEERHELTEEASGLLLAEMGRRRLEPEPAPPPEHHEVVEDRPLVQVARFRDLPEALLAKGRLESAGIEAFLYNDNMVRLDWFWSNLIGGATLHVDPENEQEAREILNTPAGDFQPDTDGEFKQPQCPECGSGDVSEEGFHKPATFFMTGFVGLPIHVGRPRWKCGRCGHTWRAEAEQDAPRE